MRNLILKTAAWRQAHSEEGQGVVEYGLVLALVSIVLALALATEGGVVMGKVTSAIAAALP